MINWLKSLIKRKPIEPQSVVARAILKIEEKTGAKYWLTANSEWLDRIPLLPNESLNLPVRAFEVGSTIEIRGKLSEEAIQQKEKL